MEIDFRKPLELNAILIDRAPTNNGIGIVVIPYRARIVWENVICIEEFAKSWLIPHDNNFFNAPKVNVITPNMVYTVIANFDEVAAVWDEYKIWSSRKPLFNFN